ncbi:hypothetical protein NPIL_268431 [Nephila pilipes]|uniref:Uncharacterized protein n=1 Tax=Nephila pilipes TaxID=299642 RepID=A0A8X6TK28_NEPPI|nr:hypothetical protein NPIL_268431 [Nephila pilipes]
MTRIAAESAFIGRRDAEVASDWSRPLIRIPKQERRGDPWHLTNVIRFLSPVSEIVPRLQKKRPESIGSGPISPTKFWEDGWDRA